VSNQEQDPAKSAKRRRVWRIIVMFATMGYVFPHALIE
jgi:hypothetical protein